MNVLGIIVNIFLPGVGTLIVGKIPQGIVQIILMVVAIILNLTVIFAILGIPIAVGTWIWALVSAATPKKPPTQRLRE
jgi:TM2 domain-containing membrane protein YozV